MTRGSDRLSAGPRKRDGARQARLKAALRENLKRRKSQARGRAEAGEAGPTHDSAGFVPNIAPDKSRD
jgi:hypothetical protein